VPAVKMSGEIGSNTGGTGGSYDWNLQQGLTEAQKCSRFGEHLESCVQLLKAHIFLQFEREQAQMVANAKEQEKELQIVSERLDEACKKNLKLLSENAELKRGKSLAKPSSDGLSDSSDDADLNEDLKVAPVNMQRKISVGSTGTAFSALSTSSKRVRVRFVSAGGNKPPALEPQPHMPQATAKVLLVKQEPLSKLKSGSVEDSPGHRVEAKASPWLEAQRALPPQPPSPTPEPPSTGQQMLPGCARGTLPGFMPDPEETTDTKTPPQISSKERSFSSDSLPSPNDKVRGTSKKSNKSTLTKGSAVSGASFFERDINMRSSRSLWLFLEEPDSSRGAKMFAIAWNYFVGCTVIFSLLQASNPPVISGQELAYTEAGIEVIFILEVLARYIACHSTKVFVKMPANWIDILASCPLILRAVVGFVVPSMQEDPYVHYALVCPVPTVRLMKLIRRFRKFHLFMHVATKTIEALKVLLFLLSLLVMVFSSILYIVEPQESVDSMTSALWLSLVTVSTVGYGDISPITHGGRFVAGVLVICSVLYMAMPISIVGDAFTKTWADRHRLLMMLRTRERLTTWGYTARDMPRLFQQFDENSNGELCLEEFCDMIDKMRVGMKPRDAEELFEVFDEDGSGGVDEKEFMRALFPNEYRVLYGRRSSFIEPGSGS